MHMRVKAGDEYLHIPPSDDPLWWENYQFNGYDPVRKIGISIYTAIKPNLGFREDYVIIHGEVPLFSQNQRELEDGDALSLGTLKMEPLQLLKKWRIQMKDSFREIEELNRLSISKKVKFDLYFESDIRPYGFLTNRGSRYEQPGWLRGKVRIGEISVDFEGRGIRDHSWEIRNVQSWGEWYWHMGHFLSGDALSFTFMKSGGKTLYNGWLGKDKYYEIRSMTVNPVFSEDILRECHIQIETSKERLDMDSRLLSMVPIPLSGGQSKHKVMETLVELNRGQGYGFLWYGR